MKTGIIHDKEQCIGCSACAAIDPKNWQIDQEGKASLSKSRKVEGHEERIVADKELESFRAVAESCPANCIHLVKEGKKII